MAAKKTADKVIEIQQPVFHQMVFHIRGVSPLDCNRMDDETREKLIAGAAGEKEAGVKSGPKSRQQQFEGSLYRLSPNDPYLKEYGAKYGFPGRGLKRVLKEAARLTVRDMVEIQQLIRVRAELCPIILGEPVMHAEIINKNMGGSSASIRARFEEWDMLVPVSFLEGDKGLSGSEVGSLVGIAGETVGLGCGRMIRGGNNGAFRIVDVYEGAMPQIAN